MSPIVAPRDLKPPWRGKYVSQLKVFRASRLYATNGEARRAAFELVQQAAFASKPR